MNHKRERLMLQYTAALLDGDWDEQERILQAVDGDPDLEEAVLVLHQELGDVLRAETDAAYRMAAQQSASDVRQLLEAHFEGRVLDRPEDASAFRQEEEEILPVTVAEVADRLKSEVTGREREQAEAALARLSQQNDPLPDALTPRQIRTLLHRLGVDLGRWFEQRFHEAAFYLESGRQDQRLIAARRVRERRRLTQERRPEQNGQ